MIGNDLEIRTLMFSTRCDRIIPIEVLFPDFLRWCQPLSPDTRVSAAVWQRILVTGIGHM